MSPRSVNTNDGRNIVVSNGKVTGYICDAKVDSYTSKVRITVGKKGSVLNTYLLQVEAYVYEGDRKISQDNRESKARINVYAWPVSNMIGFENQDNIESYLWFTTMDRLIHGGPVVLTAPLITTVIVGRDAGIDVGETDEPGEEVPYPAGYRPPCDDNDSFGSRPWDTDTWTGTRKLMQDEGMSYTATAATHDTVVDVNGNTLRYRFAPDTPLPLDTDTDEYGYIKSCWTGDWVTPMRVTRVYFFPDDCNCKRIKLWFHHWGLPGYITSQDESTSMTQHINLTTHAKIKSYYTIINPE